jgi:ferredoxin-NAD(P)+ reductase (naphthalene dioxygenase ferredoxin-specific)
MKLRIQPLDRLIDAPAGANLLAILREHAIPISYSCTAGRCGTCRCKVLDGNVADAVEPGRFIDAGGGQHALACTSILTGDCTIEIPEPDEVVCHPARVLKAAVTELERVTHDIVRLRLRPARPLAFSPGQYATLQFTPAHIRPYSMAGLPDDEELEFHIRIVKEGLVSGHVDRALRVGDAVRVTGPLGTSYLRTRHDGPMLCVAGGTGLAPVLSIVRGALESGMRNDIHLYFGVRGPRDIYCTDELARLATCFSNLRVHVVVAEGNRDASLRSGIVTEAVANDWTSLSGWRAYLCGAPPMVDAASLVVRERGIDADHIYADAFYAKAS